MIYLDINEILKKNEYSYFTSIFTVNNTNIFDISYFSRSKFMTEI